MDLLCWSVQFDIPDKKKLEIYIHIYILLYIYHMKTLVKLSYEFIFLDLNLEEKTTRYVTKLLQNQRLTLGNRPRYAARQRSPGSTESPKLSSDNEHLKLD